MFIVQTRRAKRTKKYSIVMIIAFLVFGGWGALFTMHIDVKPPDHR
jgi:hypothetical protein